MNVLIPSTQDFKVANDDARVCDGKRTLTAPETIRVKDRPEFAAVEEWRYVSADVDLPVGEHRLIFYRVSRDPEQTHMPVVARFDNGGLPGGRVEAHANLALPAPGLADHPGTRSKTTLIPAKALWPTSRET